MSAPLIIRLTPTENNEPGHALLRLPKNWKGAQNPLYLTIQHTNTSEYLHPSTSNTSNWETASCEWELTGFEEINGQLELKIGPDIIDPLLNSLYESPNYAITLRDNEGYSRNQGQLLFSSDSNILPSNARSDTEQRSATPSPHPAEEVISEPLEEPAAVEEPVAIEEPVQAKESETLEPEPTPAEVPPPVITDTKKTSHKRLLLILLGLLLILGLIIAGAWWWFNKADSDSTIALPTPEPAAVVSACDPSKMDDKTDLEFIQGCLKEEPDSETMLQIIVQAKKAGHCSIAQRLYANRSQAGDVTIASAYVKEYDPKFHKKSDCFAEPNIATATYWYETILANDPKNKVAQQRLEELN